MPLNTVYLPKVDGLQTETSNINSDPRSLSDCVDIIANREDFLESRHGHPSAPVVTSVAGIATDLYAYRNQTEKVFVPLYKSSNVFQFKTISQTGDEIVDPGSTESSIQNINGISTLRSSSVNSKPVTFAHDERLLFLTDYGMYFRPYSNAGAASANKVEFPLIRTATIIPRWINSGAGFTPASLAENKHWLVPGFQVNIKIVFEIEAKEDNKGERRLQSPTSRIYQVKNFNINNTATDRRTSNMLVELTGITISNVPAGHAVYVKIYRTPQFEIGTSPITQYFLAIEEKKITNVNVSAELGTIYLTANDDIITSLDPLYNDPTQGGFVVTNHQPIPAKNITQFRNYYVYSNLAVPTLASFGIKSLPANNNTLDIKLSGNAGDLTHTITFVSLPPSTPSQVQIPANATILNPYIELETDLTFQGLRSSQALDIVVKIVPGSIEGSVEPYGKITKVTFENKNGNNAVVRVTPDAVGFDINKFNQPGVAAIVNGNGEIQVLFSYSNYKRVASSTGFIDFEGAVSVGAAMPANQTATLYMYCINVENLETTIKTGVGADTTVSNLDLYRGKYISGGVSYLSLLPCKNGLPLPIAKPAPVSNAVFAYSGGNLVVNPQYVGLLTKPQGKLFDELAQGIADNIQRNLNNGSAIVACSGGEVIEPGVVNIEIMDYRYEKIEFKRSVGSVDAYEPPIQASATTYTEFSTSEKSVSSFIISKENNPELIPYGGNAVIAGPYEPPKVGDPNKAIVACAATKDSIYLLKEDGVARVFIGFGTLVPTIEGINIFDNTTFCVSAGSVQVLNDSVLFLAQNGVHAITGNDISKVSRSIETELKKFISQCRNENKLDSIRSFSNSSKGLYGLHIPLVGTSYVTYVLNIATMRWTKWSSQFNGAVTDLDGRLTTLVTDQSGNYIRQDKYTNGDPRAEVDQIDDEFILTGATSSTTGLTMTISLTGLGDKSYRFGSKQVYYKVGATLYSVTVSRVNANQITATFETTPPTFSDTHVLVVGVNSMIQFQPFTNNNPSVLKMYSGFHIHTEESVLGMAVSFRTEARSTFSTVTKFSTSPDNRTVYRCYIPLEAVRGRFLYRKITHTRPYQICAIPAQAIVFRDTGSERVNKSE